MRHGNERYTSKKQYYTIVEDKQVTTAAQFQFQCQIECHFLTNKITKFVDDALIFQNLSNLLAKH